MTGRRPRPLPRRRANLANRMRELGFRMSTDGLLEEADGFGGVAVTEGVGCELE